MKLKKLISLLLCGAMAMSCGVYAACAHGSGVNVVDDLKYDEYGDPVFDNVELKVWSIVGEPDNVYLDRVNDMFNAYYRTNGLSAKITSLSNGDFYTQLANTINTDPSNAPDVIVYHSERLTKLANDKIILPMDEYYEAVKSGFTADSYISNVMDECYYGGKVYGVPLDVHAGVWYVRTDILEKNGLEKPSSLSEFIEVCNALVEKYNNGELWHRAMDKDSAKCVWTKAKTYGDSYYPVVMSQFGGIETGWIPQTAVFQNGGKLTDSEGNPVWNTQGLEDVLTMFRDWQTGTNTLKNADNSDRFSYSGAFVKGDDDTNTVWSKLASGEAVFSCEGPWWIEQRFNEYEALIGDLADTEGKVYQPLDIMNMSKLYAMDESAATASDIYGVGHCFSISKTVTSKTKCVAAALYAQYMTENAVDYMQGGHLPANKNILESEQYKSKPFYTRYLQEFGDPENFVMLGNTPYYEAVYEKLKLTYSDVFTASKANVTVKEIINLRYKEAQREIESIKDL